MNYEWHLREEVLLITHRWPVILAFCLAGVVIGWGISLFWPSPYRATKEVNVGLNIYRAQEDRNTAEFANLQFVNVDDYKNWQMANLSSMILMDEITDETLRILQEEDPYWSGISRAELTGMLHAYWRNAGKWRLVAENDDPLHASQAVAAWERVVSEQVHHAIDASTIIMTLDLQLRSTATTTSQVKSRIAALEEHQQGLRAWQEQASNRPADQSTGESERWQLLASLEQANLGQGVQMLIAELPPVGATVKDISTWLEKALFLLEGEIEAHQAQLEALEDQQERLTAQNTDASRDSHGISANLLMDNISRDPPQVMVVRPTGLWVLVGGSLGLIVWAIFELVRTTMRIRTPLEDHTALQEKSASSSL